ncbi:hypothetical protein KVR01_011548 [Diaporthe batatas]|uniref:uncharacterized protein n=1 Tax=Diaporthe batatas TaxID=748121 RepID=UPI001D04EAA5|nr:uncharacterized protein KVR01_011548 [Diaporthe batatas]KAG8158426.1 hypothetical protein KVR01_011548 [Diaporthe batatas]
MPQATLTFTMAVIAVITLLLAVTSAKAALNGISTFRDGDTLFAPDRDGKIVAHQIINMTTEVQLPGMADKITVPGTIEQVVAFINATYPGHDWVADEESNATTSVFSPEGNTVYCNIGKQGSYYTAFMIQTYLRHFGSHKNSVLPGPGHCFRVSCRKDYDRTAAFYFCNDDTRQVTFTFDDVADMAQIVMDKCVEFGTPLSWVRGQAFHASLPWNVIVTAEDRC